MDATIVAVPGYFATMGAEHAYLRHRATVRGEPAPTDYEWNDTRTSLTMGVANLLVPLIVPRLLAPFTPGRGRFGRALVATAIAAVGVTTVADIIARRSGSSEDTSTASPASTARTVASIGGVTAVVAGGTAACITWADRTSPRRLYERRVLPDLGTGPVAWAVALVGWDFIYYWNHRFMHECRALWAIHVVHHSSERYNLSTALRQPVADAFGMFVPSGLLSLLGVRPSLIAQSRSLNLLYQYWIHTDAIGTLGPVEEVFNTPSLHRAHHGSNPKYLDRNHAGVLIVWDRLFGTHQVEEEPVAYGLTTNIHTYNPARVGTHEHRDMLRDVSRSRTWRQRLSHVLRGPGWSMTHRPQP